MRFRLLYLIVFLGGCVSNPPVEEYSIAEAAISAAKEAGAPKYSPGFWHRSVSAYEEGENEFGDRNYNQAKALFLRATHFSEKAEDAARLKRLKSGEVF